MPLQLDENVKALGSRAQAQLTEQFARIDAIAQENTARVLAAFSARESLAGIIDFYNNRRPHRSNRDMLPPVRLREALTCV